MLGFFFRRGNSTSQWAILIVVYCLFLTACGSTPAPVISRTPPPSQSINYHVVGQGDTLFAIAWRYELSVEALARANGLSHPYHIYSGQRLTLDIKRTNIKVSKPEPTVRVTNSIPSNVVRSKVVIPKVTKAKEQKTARVGQRKPSSLPKGEWRWQWPVKGKVARHYDSNRIFKGLNIQSVKGRKIGSAAPGVVVYAGRGLRGYGQLLIIKHSETFLSAYAHNRKMFVKEGQAVAAGQKIAEVGGDPENNGRLYFEIRKNGKPVDPIRLLPRL
ncbi:MAG: peptidoglycan DD-metalloendopeptidase family protein [Porticoccaceae bacterium]|nr:peptidoglycan DD-metalloendopeptidase family protein [Porticoccaceae bacterium]